MNMKAGVIAAALLCASLALAEDSAESVTVKLHGGSTAAGVGVNWGHGILTFEGYQYPFSVRGLTIGDVGANGFTGSGSVHNLKRAEDFNGNYAGLGAGLTIAGGGSVVTMRNQNGVTINLILTTRGLKVGLGGGGINLEIPESGFAAVQSQKTAEAAAARAERPRAGSRPPQVVSRQRLSVRKASRSRSTSEHPDAERVWSALPESLEAA